MATSSSSSSRKMIKSERLRSWSDLPPDLVLSILLRLSVPEVLDKAQKVCRSWRRVCKDPMLWRKIHMRDLSESEHMYYDLEAMCRYAVDLSQGGLQEIRIQYFATDPLLPYIALRSSNLRCLEVVGCTFITSNRIFEALVKLPLLEKFELSYSVIRKDHLKAIGRSCPNLKTLKLNWGYINRHDDEAVAIAETMPGLCHLQLLGNGLWDSGLSAILDGCPRLESLDLRRCFGVKPFGDVEKRCCERIRDFKRPNDYYCGY